MMTRTIKKLVGVGGIGLLLAGAAERNFQRWKILNVKSPFKNTSYVTIATTAYPEQILALKGFFKQRAAWMDANLEQSSTAGETGHPAVH